MRSMLLGSVERQLYDPPEHPSRSALRFLDTPLHPFDMIRCRYFPDEEDVDYIVPCFACWPRNPM